MLSELLKKNQEWAKSCTADNSEYFTEMAKGQSPEILYIGCADSRVPIERVLGLNPGDIFVHRNIANMVINTDLSSKSVINYAVQHLKVKHVVVCGHSQCGGVKAGMSNADLGIISPWLKEIKDVFRLHREELTKITDETTRYNRLIELNAQEQAFNLLKSPEVQKAFLAGDLQIHAWVFDIETGQVRDLSVDFKVKYEELSSIYKID